MGLALVLAKGLGRLCASNTNNNNNNNAKGNNNKYNIQLGKDLGN